MELQKDNMSDEEATGLQQFNPAAHGFVLPAEHRPPGGMRFYEIRNHARVDGAPDYHRLNLYLSQDGEFVTIWWGSLEHVMIEALFRNAGLEPTDYDEVVFRGHVDSTEQARQILRAVCRAQEGPQVVRIDKLKGLVCESF